MQSTSCRTEPDRRRRPLPASTRACRMVHPPFTLITMRTAKAGDHDWVPASMCARGRRSQPYVIAMKIASTRRHALQREREAEHVAVGGHELGPQEPELERQNRPGHDAHGEQRDHRLRPAACKHQQERVAATAPEPLHPQHQCREGHAEADERDVHRERQRLHLARLQQVLLVDRAERLGDMEEHQHVVPHRRGA